jgi:hypothetical protein
MVRNIKMIYLIFLTIAKLLVIAMLIFFGTALIRLGNLLVQLFGLLMLMAAAVLIWTWIIIWILVLFT